MPPAELAGVAWYRQPGIPIVNTTRFQQNVRALLVGLLMPLLVSTPAVSAQFHLYLRCIGKVSSSAKPTSAQLELAMRDNNMTALIQKSDVLPVGERMKYVATDQAYTMQMRTPVYGTRGAYHDWFRGVLFTWHPDLKKLALTRLSIDRHTGGLEGELLSIEGNVLGKLTMQCTPQSVDDVPAPKF
jgi:hypothetical protein